MSRRRISTSAAAFKASATRRRTQKAVLLEYLATRGEKGTTSFEAHKATGIPYVSAAAALSKLARDHLIHAGEERRINTVYHGTVWLLGPPPPNAPQRRGRKSIGEWKARTEVLEAEGARMEARVDQLTNIVHGCKRCTARLDRLEPG